MSVAMFLRYPFNRPGYRYADVLEPRGRGLDMLRCPVAEYLAAHEASDLTVATWCNLDFPLARMWGGQLERHGTHTPLVGFGEHSTAVKVAAALDPLVVLLG